MASDMCHVPSCSHNAVGSGTLCGECREILAALLNVRRECLVPSVAYRYVSYFKELQLYPLWRNAIAGNDASRAQRIIQRFWEKVPSISNESRVRCTKKGTTLVWGRADGGDGRTYTLRGAQWQCNNMIVPETIAARLESLKDTILRSPTS